MSDSNRTKVGFVKEVTYGTTPTSPAIKNLRVTGSGITAGAKTVQSKELRSDRMIADLIRVANEAGGPLPVEVAWGTPDDFFENVLQSAWVRTPVRDNNGTAASEITSVVVSTGVYNILTTGSSNTDFHFGVYKTGHVVRASGFTNAANNGRFRVTSATATAVTTANTSSVAEASAAAAARLKVVGFQGAAADITATATGLASTALDFTTLGLASGMWVKIGGTAAGDQFATAANNGWARINGTITATALPLDNLPTGWTVDAGTGKTVMVFTGDYCRNGTTEQSWTIEEQLQDLASPEYDYYTGMIVDQLALSLKSNAIVEANVVFIGSTVNNGTARAAGATDVAAVTNDVLNTAANIGSVADNGVALTGTTAVTALDLTLMNNIRRRPSLGTLGNADVASGTFECKGKMSMYYASNTIRTKILAGTASSFYTRVVDTTGSNGSRAYTFDIPKIKYEVGNPNRPGINTDRTMDPEFAALYSPTFGYAFQIQRTEEYA